MTFMRRRKNLGHSFSDMIDRSKSKEFVAGKKSGYFDPLSDNFGYATEQAPANPLSIWHVLAFTLIVVGLSAVMSSRLFWLQIVEGTKNRQYADSNRIQAIKVAAPRGLIYDREMQILARNGPGWRLTLIGSAPIKSGSGLTENIGKDKKVRFLTEDQANRLRATDSATAAKLEVDQIRQYNDGEIFAHVLGYLGEISQMELTTANLQGCASTTFVGQIDQSRNCDYRLGDLVGREGAESVYETVLRGVSGKKLVEVDASGSTVANIATQDPKPGLNLVLSLDAGLQKASYEALKEAIAKVGSIPIKSGSMAGPDSIGAGAVVAANPSTGEIYALVSYPSYDPGVFVDPTESGKVAGILNNPNQVLLNRPIAGTYPPGSTFKIITATAGLESGRVKADTKVEDTGVIYLGSFAFPNWYWIQYGKTEGIIDIVRAIARSNDIFFYRVGEWVGNTLLTQFARVFGLGQKLGIDLPGETAGLVPTDEWKKQTQGEPWYPGDTLHMAIGQGYVLATPLQIMSATAVIANGGTLYQPYLLQKIINQEGQVLWQAQPKVIRSQIIKEANLKLIREGLAGACATGGTGWPLFEFKIPVACKTGTAEFGDPQNRTHAWFTTYAPVDQPEIVVTVLIEGGGEGSSIAGPVARKIYEYWFRDRL